MNEELDYDEYRRRGVPGNVFWPGDKLTEAFERMKNARDTDAEGAELERFYEKMKLFFEYSEETLDCTVFEDYGEREVSSYIEELELDDLPDSPQEQKQLVESLEKILWKMKRNFGAQKAT